MCCGSRTALHWRGRSSARTQVSVASGVHLIGEHCGASRPSSSLRSRMFVMVNVEGLSGFELLEVSFRLGVAGRRDTLARNRMPSDVRTFPLGL